MPYLYLEGSRSSKGRVDGVKLLYRNYYLKPYLPPELSRKPNIYLPP